jgi:hypothetical protein
MSGFSRCPKGVEGLGEDWRATVQHVGPLDREQRLWQAFWREREHILRRGDERWPAYKILLQLAVEHADDSPVTGTSKNLRFEKSAFVKSGSCIINLPRNRGFSRCPDAAGGSVARGGALRLGVVA